MRPSQGRIAYGDIDSSGNYTFTSPSDPDRDQQIRAVEEILSDLGLADKPRILVWNKADQLEPEDADQKSAIVIFRHMYAVRLTRQRKEFWRSWLPSP